MAKPIALVTVLTLTLAACSPDHAGLDPTGTIESLAVEDDTVICEIGQIDGDLNTYNWADYIDPDLITAFATEFGVDVVEDFYDSNETLLAKLQSGASYDLIVPSDYMVQLMVDEGLLEEVQRDAIPNLRNLDSSFNNPPYDPDTAHSVAYLWGTTGIAVNLEVMGEGFDPSWALLFDPDRVSQYPGGISLIDDARETMGAALKFLGYSLNSVSEEELMEAADLIAGVSENASFRAATREEGGLVDQGHTASHIPSYDVPVDPVGAPASTTTTDAPQVHTYVIPAEGAAIWVDNMAVPITAEHPCTAHAFINFLLDAENGAALTNFTGRASPNRASRGHIDPEILEDKAIYPSEEVAALLEIISDTGDFETRYTDYFAIAKS